MNVKRSSLLRDTDNDDEKTKLFDGRGPATGPALRPRDAASLILIDRSTCKPRLLMGQRNRSLQFMPDKFVFPGGGTDSADGRVKAANSLKPQDEHKLLAGMGKRASIQRARALAMTAIRETYEETGLLLGVQDRDTTDTGSQHPWAGFAATNQLPDLSRLRYVARAITPPGHVRRYDARFFLSFTDEVLPLTISSLGGGNGMVFHPHDTESSVFDEPELVGLKFFTITEALQLNIAAITRIILLDIQNLLLEDRDLSSIYPVPEYRMRHGRHVREVI